MTGLLQSEEDRNSGQKKAGEGLRGILYTVGTLSYTRRQLLNVFVWMLWGDLCLNVMESLIPRMVPLQLQELGASNALIGVLTGSIFSVMNWVMNPIISTWSDRHRSSLGRRIPFMLYASPPLALFLVLVGFAANIAGFVHAEYPGAGRAITAVAGALLPDVGTLPGLAQLTIAIFALALILYKFFDLFPQCVYYYLFTDVIPQPVMGRFVCLFRVMATMGGVIFHYFLLQWAQTHPKTIYLGCALLYLVAFVGLSLVVKEGSYPPPPAKAGQPMRAVIRWCRECFSMAFYWKYFVTFACSRWAFVPFNTFLIIYAQKKLGMGLDSFGHMIALMLIIQVPVLLLLGPVLDRFHPIRVTIIGYLLLALTAFGGFALIRAQESFTVLTIAVFVAVAVLQGAVSTLGPRLLPRQRYGQFSAANAMVAESGMIVLAWLCGRLLDRVGETYIYVWLGSFSCLGIVLSLILAAHWKRCGGDRDYQSPGEFA